MAKKHMDEERYNLIKELLNSGFPVSRVRELLGISTSTISYIQRSDTFEGYCEIRDSDHQKNKQKSEMANVENDLAKDNLQYILIKIAHIMEDMNEKIDLLLAK